jgi:hypothetical protein
MIIMKIKMNHILGKKNRKSDVRLVLLYIENINGTSEKHIAISVFIRFGCLIESDVS